MRVIEREETRGLLARAVLTQGPDFIYSKEEGVSCWYRPETVNKSMSGKPELAPDDPRRKTGCLIGTVVGLISPEAQAALVDGRSATMALQGLEGIGIQFTGDAIYYLYCAQRYQDSGNTWGEAYRAAETNGLS